MDNQPLVITSSPHVVSGSSIPKLMGAVLIALAPAAILAVWFFGMPALKTILLSIVFCLVFESLFGPIADRKRSLAGILFDGSAVVTGLLLAMNLPPDSPWWLTAVGALIAIGLAKQVFGGLGKNPFNPAIVARVALLIAFPVHMTQWRVPFAPVDGVTAATALGVLKTDGARAAAEQFRIFDLLTGQVPGSLGEVSALLLLIGGLFLLVRGVISWHIPVSYLATLAAITAIPWFRDPEKFASPLFHLAAGGVMLGAWFMATDLVTSPINPKGMLVFGAGCGAITAVIRLFGSYPEGTSFAILVMNALTPLIEKWTRPVPVGRRAVRRAIRKETAS